jgi:hypothetical protein
MTFFACHAWKPFWKTEIFPTSIDNNILIKISYLPKLMSLCVSRFGVGCPFRVGCSHTDFSILANRTIQSSESNVKNLRSLALASSSASGSLSLVIGSLVGSG